MKKLQLALEDMDIGLGEMKNLSNHMIQHLDKLLSVKQIVSLGRRITLIERRVFIHTEKIPVSEKERFLNLHRQHLGIVRLDTEDSSSLNTPSLIFPRAECGYVHIASRHTVWGHPGRPRLSPGLRGMLGE